MKNLYSIVLVLLFVSLFSCNRKEKTITFYKNYSFEKHKGFDEIDTLSPKSKQKLNKRYCIVYKLNDSVSKLYFINIDSCKYYLDTINQEATVCIKSKNSNTYYSYTKKTTVPNIKFLLPSHDLRFFTNTIKINFSLTEKGWCAPKPNEMDSPYKRLEAYLTITTKEKTEFLSICLKSTDTVGLINNFISIENFNQFKKKLFESGSIRE